MKPAEFVKKVSDTLYKNANSQNAKAMKKYLLDQFEFIGLKKPFHLLLLKFTSKTLTRVVCFIINTNSKYKNPGLPKSSPVM